MTNSKFKRTQQRFNSRLNTVLICIRNHSLFELCINILNDTVLVLFCSCYVFIVCLILFASYIITSYMDYVRLSHLNKDYLLTYLLTYIKCQSDQISSHSLFSTSSKIAKIVGLGQSNQDSWVPQTQRDEVTCVWAIKKGCSS